jgi:glc operon protein GlcG
MAGAESDAARVAVAQPSADALTAFRHGGFNVPLVDGADGRPERVRLLRAFNALRQYDEAAVGDAWARMGDTLLPGGLLIERTSDLLGRRAVFNLLTRLPDRLVATLDSAAACSALSRSHPRRRSSMYTRHHLSHADAQRVIAAIQSRLESERKGAAVAVVDSQGELLAFVRTDGCKLPSVQIALNKAYTAAREQRPSRTVGEASREEGFPMTNFGDLRYTAWGGGVPILYQGQLVGAVGVSGLPEEEDMLLAALGAAVIA